MSLRAVLFDVGGTLFDDVDDTGDPVRLRRLRAILPGVPGWERELLADVVDPLAREEGTYAQDTRRAIRLVLERNGAHADDALVERIRAACCLPLPESGGASRAGALDALRDARSRGLRIALVTNVLWRTRTDVLADWESLGFTDVDAAVTSLDVGRYKPHPAMFETALEALSVEARDAVMVGNSRAADIAPAKALGMRAVLVRSRETSTSDVEPDAVVAELTELPPILERWAPERGKSTLAERRPSGYKLDS